jgi:hypothetical protein
LIIADKLQNSIEKFNVNLFTYFVFEEKISFVSGK